MSQDNAFQLSANAAETYELQRVPAIFGPMAEATLDAITLPACRKVLDVACGTGAMTRAVAARLSTPCHLTGCDLNPAMIEVARASTPEGLHTFDWIAASADSMPLDDGSVDLAFCQHGLQFFPDKPAALGEINRVLRTGGRVVITCWRSIPRFFEVVAGILGRHLGEAAAATSVKPFIWNDADEIAALIRDAGFECGPPDTLRVARRLPADPETMRAELLSTPNEPVLRAAGDKVIDAIVSKILEGVAHFREGDMLVMPQEAHLFDATSR